MLDKDKETEESLKEAPGVYISTQSCPVHTCSVLTGSLLCTLPTTNKEAQRRHEAAHT